MSWLFELDASGGRLEQPRHEPRHRRLPAARLADEAQCLAWRNRERDAVDGVDDGAALALRAARREVLDEVLDHQQRGGCSWCHRPSLTTGQAMRWSAPTCSSSGTRSRQDGRASEHLG